MSRADRFRERQAAIAASRAALRAWTATLGLAASDPKRQEAYGAFRLAEQREREAVAAYQVAVDLDQGF